MTGARTRPEVRPTHPIDLDVVDRMPSLPEVISRILALVDDPTTSAQMIADVVGQDPSMVASILRMVNSPFYGLSRRITSIHHAVVLLGFRTIRNMAFSAVLVRDFGESSVDGRFARVNLWRHSVACAIGARLLAGKLRSVDPEEAFLTGLIHDMGLVVLDQYFHTGFASVLDLVESGRTLCEAERETCGLDHAAIGGALARRWNFPPGVAEAIACHHNPERAEREPVLTAIVHVASTGLWDEPWSGDDGEEVGSAEEADGAPGLRPRQVWQTELLDPKALAIARIDAEALSEVREGFEEEWARAQVFLSLLT